MLRPKYMTSAKGQIVTVGVTGASGAILAQKTLELLGADGRVTRVRLVVLCVRDTPLSRVHLENMLCAQQAGAVIMPFLPVLYDQPRSIDDLVTRYVGRVLSQVGLPQKKMYRWTGRPQSSREAKA
jgi:3-polyprenyl-4-hydroxybenzoate decarboxylase